MRAGACCSCSIVPARSHCLPSSTCGTNPLADRARPAPMLINTAPIGGRLRDLYNTRFLILPWVRVEHLAPHILGHMGARTSADWRIYGHRIYFLETFVDPERFRGTC